MTSYNSKRSMSKDITHESWREKYFKVKTDLEHKKKELINERQKTIELSKKNKTMIKKEQIYDSKMEIRS